MVWYGIWYVWYKTKPLRPYPYFPCVIFVVLSSTLDNNDAALSFSAAAALLLLGRSLREWISAATMLA
jgi:hypothetical protein